LDVDLSANTQDRRVDSLTNAHGKMVEELKSWFFGNLESVVNIDITWGIF